VGGLEVALVGVHPAQFSNGLFASWFERYRSVGEPGPSLSALQVVLPTSSFCDHHARQVPRLDQSAHASGLGLPNRAERRAFDRGRSRNRRGPRRHRA
jgi:hypothetical protein